jgi:WD40 repeat protein
MCDSMQVCWMWACLILNAAVTKHTAAALCRSHKGQFVETDPLAGEGEYVVTSGDDGRVRLFAYPCVIDDAPCRTYLGHCSHVMNVRFSPDNRWVVSVGGDDRCGMQWRVLKEAQDEVGR